MRNLTYAKDTFVKRINSAWKNPARNYEREAYVIQISFDLHKV